MVGRAMMSVLRAVGYWSQGKLVRFVMLHRMNKYGYRIDSKQDAKELIALIEDKLKRYPIEHADYAKGKLQVAELKQQFNTKKQVVCDI